MADADVEVKEREEDELLQESDKSARIRANRNLYKVLPVRLPADKWELMRKEANDLGIGPSTLARIWILDSLRRRLVEDVTGQPWPEKLFAAKEGKR